MTKQAGGKRTIHDALVSSIDAMTRDGETVFVSLFVIPIILLILVGIPCLTAYHIVELIWG